jgi:hypothetical protein
VTYGCAPLPEDAVVRRHLPAFVALLVLFVVGGLYLHNRPAATHNQLRLAARPITNPEPNPPRSDSPEPLIALSVSFRYQGDLSLFDNRVDVGCTTRVPGSDEVKTELLARNILIGSICSDFKYRNEIDRWGRWVATLEVTAEQAEQISRAAKAGGTVTLQVRDTGRENLSIVLPVTPKGTWSPFAPAPDVPR